MTRRQQVFWWLLVVQWALLFALLAGCATPRTFSVMCFEDIETSSYVCTTSIPAKRVPEINPAPAK